MSLLDSRVNDKASTGELSEGLPKVSTGISVASTGNGNKNLLATSKSRKRESKASQ
jgi:hypothetical protein